MLWFATMTVLMLIEDFAHGIQESEIEKQMEFLESDTETIVQNGTRLVSISCGNKTDKSLTFHPNSQEFSIEISGSRTKETDDIIPGLNYSVIVSWNYTDESLSWFELTSTLDDVNTQDGHFQSIMTSCDSMIPPIVFQYRITKPIVSCVTFRLQYIRSETEGQLDETTKTICKSQECRKYIEVQTTVKFESPNYPNDYPDNFECIYILYTTGSLPIHLQFQYFSLENAYDEECYDFVTIETDHTNSSRICGTKDKEQLKTLHFTCLSGAITVEFKTDSKIVHPGFQALGYIMRKEDCNYTTGALSGSVTSPFYPNNYLPLMNCIIRILLPVNYRIVVDIMYIDFEQNDHSCQNDYIRIGSLLQDGIYVNHGIFCNEEYENTSIFSSSSEVELIFSFNYFIEGKGFHLVYHGVKICENKTHNSSSGIFASANYPQNYLSDITCFYSFGFRNNNYVIQLEFDTFDLEAQDDIFRRGVSCTKDYLEIKVDEDVDRICGHWQGTRSKLFFFSKTGYIEIYFRSDSIGTRQGFMGTWRMVLKESYSSTCRDITVDMPEYILEYVAEKRGWKSARGNCLEKGGDLVVVHTSAEEVLIQDLLVNISFNGNCSLRHEAIWIGASDVEYEGGFTWVDGDLLQYTNWFLGWPEYEYRNRQPSDDGLSSEDCVEMRKIFHLPSKGTRETDRYYWNDRNCNIENPYICQYFKHANTIEWKSTASCNHILNLNVSYTFSIITSPNFPENYDSLDDCDITIYSPATTNIAVDFISFDIEFDERCAFDNLTLSSVPNGIPDKVYCGNWSRKTKLLRWKSKTNFAQLHFQTDESVTSYGFKLNISLLLDGEDCVFNNSMGESNCSLVFFPTKTHLPLGNRHCDGINADISRLSLSSEVFNFLASLTEVKDFVNLTLWEKPSDNFQKRDSNCSTQLIFGTGVYPNFNFTTREQITRCNRKHQFVCRKRKNQVKISPQPTIFTKKKGAIIHPWQTTTHYGNNENKTYQLIASSLERIFIEIVRLDIEFQDNCLYDYVEIHGLQKKLFFCGSTENYDALLYWSVNNSVLIHFHSDDSIVGKGFEIRWQFFRPSACIELQEGDKSKSFRSLNFPYPYPTELYCCRNLKPNVENPLNTHRLLVFFTEIRFLSKTTCLLISDDNNTIHEACGGINSTYRSFLSTNDHVQLCYNATGLDRGEGFHGFYELVSSELPRIDEERYLKPGVNDSGSVSSINYPGAAPTNHVHSLKLRTDIGYRIFLSFPKLFIPTTDLCEETRLSVLDTSFGNDHSKLLKKLSCQPTDFCGPFISYLNRMTVLFETGPDTNFSSYLGKYTIEKDTELFSRTIDVPTNSSFDECVQNSTCLNGGNCTFISKDKYTCKCPQEFTGLFCQVTLCEASPCGRGICNHTHSEQSCICEEEFWGQQCNLTHAQCGHLYCNGRGKCIGFDQWKPKCKCDNIWLGESCATKVINPSAMPSVTSKLLNEPIWVGMIVMLNLLFVFGSLYVMKKKCGKYIKCCQDTKEILRRREDGIPAHSNDPIPQCPTLSEYSFSELAASVTAANAKKCRSGNTIAEHYQISNSPVKVDTPTVNMSNKEAAARLFASYKSDEENNDKEGSCSPIGGLLEGLVLSKPPFERIPVQVPELILQPPPIPSKSKQWRFNHTASIPEREDREASDTLSRCHSVAVTNPSLYGFNNSDKKMPDLYILNENSSFTEGKNFQNVSHEQHHSNEYCDLSSSRYFTTLGAKGRRRVYAEKSKSACYDRHDGMYRDLDLVENGFHETREKDVHFSAKHRSFNDYDGDICFLNDSQLSVDKVTAPCLSESRNGTYIQRKRLSRDRKTKSEPYVEHRHYGSISFSDESKRLCNSESTLVHSRNCCRKKRYLIINRGNKSSHSYCSSSYADSDTDVSKSVPHLRRNGSRTGKRRTYNKRRKQINNSKCIKTLSDTSITSSSSDKDRFYNVPVRKSKSNDLKFRQTTANCSDRVQMEMMARPLRHSFHGNKSMKSNLKDPDEMLNEDQVQTFISRSNITGQVPQSPDTNTANSVREDNEKRHNEIIEAEITLQRSFSDSLSSSAMLSVNDTDTGFSSSSKSLKSGKDQNSHKNLKMSRFKNISSSKTKDSAYQTNQSSVEKYSLDVERQQDNEEKRWVYHQLQQAAWKLTMYDARSRISNDSAIQGISEDDCLNGYESDNSLRDTKPRRASLPGLLKKSFPLEQVSEETDNISMPDVRRNAAPHDDIVISDNNEKDNSVTVDQRSLNSLFSPPSRTLQLSEEIELDTISV